MAFRGIVVKPKLRSSQLANHITPFRPCPLIGYMSRMPGAFLIVFGAYSIRLLDVQLSTKLILGIDEFFDCLAWLIYDAVLRMGEKKCLLSAPPQ